MSIEDEEDWCFVVVLSVYQTYFGRDTNWAACTLILTNHFNHLVIVVYDVPICFVSLEPLFCEFSSSCQYESINVTFFNGFSVRTYSWKINSLTFIYHTGLFLIPHRCWPVTFIWSWYSCGIPCWGCITILWKVAICTPIVSVPFSRIYCICWCIIVNSFDRFIIYSNNVTMFELRLPSWYTYSESDFEIFYYLRYITSFT